MPTWLLSRILWAAALVPPVVLLVYIYREDRVEKEPPGLLVRLLLGGALSVLSALAWERLTLSLLGPPAGAARAALYCLLGVGLAEEGGKFLFLRLLSWRDPAFNYRFDGIVYAVFVSMGFAAVENLLYVAGDGTLRTALVRAVTAIPGHAAFAVFMGFYYGCAKRYADAAARCPDATLARSCRRRARRSLARALWLPALLHGLYDFLLTLRLRWAGGVFALFVLALLLRALFHVRTAGRHDLPV